MGRDSKLNRNRHRLGIFFYGEDGSRREEIVPQRFANVERLVVPGHPDHFLVRIPLEEMPSSQYAMVHARFQGANLAIAPNFVALINTLQQLGEALVMCEPPNPILDIPKSDLLLPPGMEQTGRKVGVYNSPLKVELVNAKGEPIEEGSESGSGDAEPEEREFSSAHGGANSTDRGPTILDFPAAAPRKEKP